jgi:hypothetical protein
MASTIHYTGPEYGTKTPCGREITTVACWDDRDAITCKTCTRKLAEAGEPAPSPAQLLRESLETIAHLASSARETNPNEKEQAMRLRQLQQVSDLVEAAQVAQHRLVAELREPKWKNYREGWGWSWSPNEPTSWETIAKAQGVSKQGAQQRFNRGRPKVRPVDPAQLTIDD